MCPNLRELAFRVFREAFVKLLGDRKPKDAVAEKLKALVRVLTRCGPGRMREDVGDALVRKRVDQLE